MRTRTLLFDSDTGSVIFRISEQETEGWAVRQITTLSYTGWDPRKDADRLVVLVVFEETT